MGPGSRRDDLEKRDDLAITRASMREPEQFGRIFDRHARSVFAAAVLLVVLGVVAVRAARPPEPIDPAGLAPPQSVEQAIPGLLDRVARSSWSPIAWDDPDPVKAQLQASELARIDRDVPMTWTAAHVDERRAAQQLTVQRALLLPQTIVVDQRVEIVFIDDIVLEDDDHAYVEIEWYSQLRIRPHELDPRQIGSYAPDAIGDDGWLIADRYPHNDDIFHLVREDGAWKVDSYFSTVPGWGS